MIDSSLINELHLRSTDKKILPRNAGRYVGGELTKQEWVVNITGIASSIRQWCVQFGEEKRDDI